MATEPRSHLTTRDHVALQALLDAYDGPHGPYAQLLEQKLRESAVSFSDDIAATIVTLGSSLIYTVDGRISGPHVLVDGDVDGDVGADAEASRQGHRMLSIRTLRGLALLGLAEGDAVAVDLGEGASEELVVRQVLSQPEAEARHRTPAPSRIAAADPGSASTVVSFRPKPPRQTFADPGPDDDDPGPRAA